MKIRVKNMSENRPRIWHAFVFLILIGGLIVWWVNSLPNEDPLWFVRTFTQKADWIVIYHEGETTMFFPCDSAYQHIMDAFADGVAHWKGYENLVGLSDENLELYRTEWKMLELHYNKPVKVHTRHFFPEAHNFFVPLSGTHAQYYRVFSGLTDTPRIGVLNMHADKFAALQDAIAQALQDAAD
jgi:hypothetical protein